MNTLIIDLGKKTSAFTAQKAAENDMKWWAKKIAAASIKGKTRMTRWSFRSFFIFNDRFNPPADYFYQYTNALQALLGQDFIIKVEYGEKVLVSW